MRKPYLSALCLGLIVLNARAADLPDIGGTNARLFAVKGVVRELEPAEQTAIISNEVISNYMDAMTMPFKVRDPKELDGLQPGDEVAFRLHVTSTDSWVDQIVHVGMAPEASDEWQVASDAKFPSPDTQHPSHFAAPGRNLLWDCDFTNELGQPVSLSDFHGQALAITFFYTRCPLPNYCPRLSKNFEEASQKLESLPGAPTNWHFLSVSFDAQFDDPAVLKAYGESYQYDPNHWSFLTGPPDKIAELAEESGVRYQSDNGLINHNFRTLIVDANGHLETVFPTSGDLSDPIVAAILKAATVTNRTVVAR